MPYIVKWSGAGPWAQGQEIPDDEFEAHSHHEKFLRTGSVVKKGSEADTRGRESPEKVADLQAQIAQLQAQLAMAQGTPVEPTAPANVEVHLDPEHPSGGGDAARRDGDEVVQPTPGDVVVGTVTPPKPKKGEQP